MCIALSAAAAEAGFPPRGDRISDQAHVLTRDATTHLYERLEGLDRGTGQRVVIVTVSNLRGQPIEDYGAQLANAWDIGEKDTNIGAILLVAPKERSGTLVAGYGFQGKLTDDITHQILETGFLQNIRDGKVQQGLVAGITQMSIALPRNPQVKREAAAPQAPPPVQQQYPFSDNAFFIGFFGFLALATWSAYWEGGVLGVLLMILSMFIPALGKSDDKDERFKGGGGSFGGGGASSRW